MSRRDWFITLIGLAVLGFVAHILYKKEVARQHLYEMWRRRTELVRQIDPLDGQLRKGKRVLDDKDYASAKKILEETRKDARALLDNLDNALAECQSEIEKNLFTPMKAQVEEIEKEAEELAMSEQVRYGAEGLILFEGKWVKPERAKEIQEKRFEEAQRAKGLVLFEGKWVTPEERDRIKEQRFAEEQRAKGLVLFRGEWITREKMKEMLDEARKAAAQAAAASAAPKRVPLAAAPAGSGFTLENRTWVLDDFESGAISWQPEQWADSAQLEIGALDGSKAMKVTYAGGQQQKSALARGFAPMDVTSRAKLLMDVQNLGKKSVRISIMFGADQAYETRERTIGPGTFKDVAFDIKGPIFKCAMDNWQQYKFPIGRPEAVNRVTLMINTPAQILIDNIRLVAP